MVVLAVLIECRRFNMEPARFSTEDDISLPPCSRNKSVEAQTLRISMDQSEPQLTESLDPAGDGLPRCRENNGAFLASVHSALETKDRAVQWRC